MNIRVRKIRLYRVISCLLLLVSLGLNIFSIYQVITSRPEKIILDMIALSLTAAFAIGQIILIASGKDKESKLLDIAFNTDYTVNKLALVIILVGTSLGLGLDILTLVVLFTRTNTVAVICSMYIIMAIATYLLLNCVIYLIFTVIFRKKELTLEDYAK